MLLLELELTFVHGVGSVETVLVVKVLVPHDVLRQVQVVPRI